MRENAAAASEASKKVAQANQAELKSITAKAEALKRANDQAKNDNKNASEQSQTLGQLRKALSALKSEYDVTSQNAAKMDAEIRKTSNAIKQNEQAIRAASVEQVKANQIDLRALRTYNEKAQALNNLRARYKQLNCLGLFFEKNSTKIAQKYSKASV